MSITIPPKGNDDKKIGANFAPLSVAAQSTPSDTVEVRAGSYFTATGEFMEFAGGIVAFVPAAQHEWILVKLTDAGVLVVDQQLASLGLPVPAEGEMPLAAIYVAMGITEITSDMIYDARPLFKAQNETVTGGIQVALDDRYTEAEADALLLAKADDDGTAGPIFTLGQLSTSADIDVVAGTGTLRYNDTTSKWQLSNNSGAFADIDTATPATWGSITGTVSAQTDLQAELDLKNDKAVYDAHIIAYDAHNHGLRTLSDVDSVISAAEDDVLTWNDTVNKWYPKALPVMVDDKATWGNLTGAISAQVDLQLELDTKAIKVSPVVTGDFAGLDAFGQLTDSGYNPSMFELANSNIQAHIIASGNPHATTLNGLTGVVLATPADNDVLTYSAGDWVNAPSKDLGEFAVGSLPAAGDHANSWAMTTDATPTARVAVRSDGFVWKVMAAEGATVA